MLEPAVPDSPSEAWGCKITAASACPWDSLRSEAHGWRKARFESGRLGTGCAFGDAYGFAVNPGDPDRALVFFMGGGGCWNYLTCTSPRGWSSTLSGDPSQTPQAGVFNRTDPANPFRNHTFLFIPYCTGDMHTGTAHVTYDCGRDWRGNIDTNCSDVKASRDVLRRTGLPDAFWSDPVKPIQRVRHVGHNNVEATLGWFEKNRPGGGRGLLKSLVVVGTSAGSIGAGAWARALQQRLRAERMEFILDSGMPTIPYAAGFVRHWGGCSTPLWDAWHRLQCKACLRPLCGKAFAARAMRAALGGKPNVTFSFVNSAADPVQTGLANLVRYMRPSASLSGWSPSGGAVRLTIGSLTGTCVSFADFYAEANAVLTRHFSGFDNFRAYFFPGRAHVISYPPLDGSGEAQQHWADLKTWLSNSSTKRVCLVGERLSKAQAERVHKDTLPECALSLFKQDAPELYCDADLFPEP